MSWLRAGYVAACVVLLAYGCSDEVSSSSSNFPTGSASTSTQTGTPGAGGLGFGGDDGGVAGNGNGASASTNVGGASTGSSMGPGGGCVAGATQCTDCIDNDGDGWIDAWDVECVGPLDDDEGSFATGIPGDNSDPCKQDCFFDGNSGSGNDGCLWDLACDPMNPGAPDCPYDPNKNNCPPPPSQKCLDNCAAFTPNGCDCFGCCLITLPDKSTVTIELGPGCDAENAADPTVCKPCTQQQGCLNPCDPCEYCLGKTTLPPECTPDGGTGNGGSGGGSNNGCPPGEQAYTPNTPCPANYYCLTGCCVQIPS